MDSSAERRPSTTSSESESEDDAIDRAAAEKLEAINALVALPKGEFRAKYVAPTYNGIRLADSGEYANPSYYARRSWDMMALGYEGGLAEVVVLCRVDPRVAFTTGKIASDYIGLVEVCSGCRKQVRKLKVLPVGGTGRWHVCIGAYSREARRFETVDTDITLAAMSEVDALAARMSHVAETQRRMMARPPVGGNPLAAVAMLAALAGGNGQGRAGPHRATTN